VVWAGPGGAKIWCPPPPPPSYHYHLSSRAGRALCSLSRHLSLTSMLYTTTLSSLPAVYRRSLTAWKAAELTFSAGRSCGRGKRREEEGLRQGHIGTLSLQRTRAPPPGPTRMSQGQGSWHNQHTGTHTWNRRPTPNERMNSSLGGGRAGASVAAAGATPLSAWAMAACVRERACVVFRQRLCGRWACARVRALDRQHK